MLTFEGSYLGNAGKLTPQARLECGVCWWVYGPAVGDPDGQIPPGVPFAELPDQWRCPGCDGERHKFMVVPE